MYNSLNNKGVRGNAFKNGDYLSKVSKMRSNNQKGKPSGNNGDINRVAKIHPEIASLLADIPVEFREILADYFSFMKKRKGNENMPETLANRMATLPARIRQETVFDCLKKLGLPPGIYFPPQSRALLRSPGSPTL